MKHLKEFNENEDLDPITKETFDLETKICFDITRRSGQTDNEDIRIVKSAVDRVLTRNNVTFAAQEDLTLVNIYYVVLDGKWTVEEIWDLFDEEVPEGTQQSYIIYLRKWELAPKSWPETKRRALNGARGKEKLQGNGTGLLWKSF